MINLYVSQHQYLIFIGFAVNVSIETFTLLIFLNFFFKCSNHLPSESMASCKFHAFVTTVFNYFPPPLTQVFPHQSDRVSMNFSRKYYVFFFENFRFIYLSHSLFKCLKFDIYIYMVLIALRGRSRY